MNTFSKSLLALALFSGSPLAGAQQYSLKEIPIPPGFVGPLEGTGINASGEVVGSAWFQLFDIQPHLFVYSKGITTDLGDDNPGTNCDTNVSGVTGAGINASGQIAATICATTEFPSAALYADGVYTPFAGSGIYNVLPFASSSAINAGGFIVGNILVGVGCAGNDYHSFIYDSGTRTLQDLGGLLGCSSQAFAINDAGQVAGYFTDSTGNSHAYLYTNGNTTDLGNLGAAGAWAYGINAKGEVTGYSAKAGGVGPDAFLYANGAMQDIGNLGGLAGSTGYAINAGGDIVGISYTTGNTAQHAFVYSAGAMLDLNSQISAANAKKYTLVNAVAINDNGQIVVQGYVKSDTSKNTVSFLLTPLAPAVSPSVTGTLGTNGWYVGDTTLTWYVTGTPVPTKSGCGKAVVPNTKGATYTCSATNTLSTASESIVIKRDAVAPKASIRKPVNGATYKQGTSQIAAYSCSDATSGVASCIGTVPDKTAFPTSSLGSNTFTVSATDNAGNTASSSVTYTVQ